MGHDRDIPETCLGPPGQPDPEACLRLAARSDWRAALAVLESAPETRQTWSDPARQAAVVERVLGKCLVAIRQAALPPEDERRVLLLIQASGFDLSADLAEDGR